jgi:hypothetical protein
MTTMSGGTVTVSGNTYNVSAEADFSYNSGSNLLTVTITNTQTSSGGAPGNLNGVLPSDMMLAAIAWGQNSQANLSASSGVAADTASVSSGSSLLNGTGGSTTLCGMSSTDVSCGFAFDQLSYSAGGQSFMAGISSIGYGTGCTTANAGSFFQKCDVPNFAPSGGSGTIGGILNGNGIPFAPGDFVTRGGIGATNNTIPFVVTSAQFVLSASGLFSLSQIGNVDFVYGADTPVNFGVGVGTVPEPGFYGALAIGMFGLCWAFVRRRAKAQS